MPATTIYQRPRPDDTADERIVTSTCAHNCGGRCIVNAHVRDGQIVKISTTAGTLDPAAPPLYACVRGQAAADRVYHPDRLKYPMRRVGPRGGGGEFERISWDEALDETAARMLQIRDKYGADSILDACLSGSTSALQSRAVIARLLNMFGGRTELWGSASFEANVFASQHTFGTRPAGRDHVDYANSELILLWGWSPGDGTFGTGTFDCLKQAKKGGARIICVDPRQTHTSTTLADQHISIRPSTDTAMLVAMAYVIVSEGLQDQAYLDRYVLGFDEAHLPVSAAPGSSYRAYLMGEADGQPKTAEWAEEITGVPAATIVTLARQFATAGPAAIHCGLAPGRTATGEQFHRAAHALAAMTGNVGIAGGNSGDSLGARSSSAYIGKLPMGDNPVGTRVNMALLADLLTRGKEGGYPADIKMYVSAMGNELNQYPNTGKTAAALADPENVEFVLVLEHFMTPTAQLADILLPATTSWERNDIHQPWGGIGNYAIFMNQAIEPMYECRNDLDICTDLATRLGIEGYNDKTDVEWLRHFCEQSPIDDFERFRAEGVVHLPDPAESVAHAAQIRDPANHPFNTPSGKIEIYATGLAQNPDCNGLGVVPAVPTYIAEDSPGAPYSLRLHSAKSKARTHSTHANQPKLASIDPQRVWIHPDDAAERGIGDDQTVRVFNDLGVVEIPAHVTDRTMAGVVSINAGAWYDPGADGTDRGGSVNVLTTDRPSPGGALAHNTCYVEVAVV